MDTETINNILEQFPFLSYGKMDGTDYIGIIHNSDSQLLSMYIYTIIPTKEEREFFLKRAEIWWWESNRQLPISIFDKEFRIFRGYLKHFSRKDFELISGPAVSLQETMARRVRKKQVTLVKKVT